MKSRQILCDRKTFWMIFLTAGVVSVPLLTDYLLTGCELQASLSRIEAMVQGMGKTFPVRIGPWGSLDYGYGGASFQADVFYLIPALLRLAGLPLSLAYKLTLFLVNMVTAALSLRCFEKCFQNREIGLAGSVLYTWCPYRLTELYINGNLGDIVAWSFLPIVLSGLIELYTMNEECEDYSRLWVPLAFGFSLLTLSSTNLLFLGGGMTVIIMLLMGKRTLRRKVLLIMGKTVTATFFVNAWFLVPMLLRMRDVSTVGILIPRDIRSGGMYFAQYMSIFQWGGDSNALGQNGMVRAQAMGPGITVAVLLLIYLWALFVGKCKEQKEIHHACIRLLWVCLVLMILSSNSFPWDLLQDRNMLFSVMLSLLRTPARWGIPACTCMIAAACLMLSWLNRQYGEKAYKLTLSAVIAVSFGTTQFLLGNIMKTRSYVKLEENAMELIPLQVIAEESMVWRMCEVLSGAVIGCCLLLVLVRRRRNVKKV